MLKFEDLNPLQKDVFKEIGNIGSGHAATALSQLLLERIHMTVPNISILPLAEVSNYLGGAEEIVVGIFMKVFGDAPGKMMFIFNQNDAVTLESLVINRNLPDEESSGEFDQSVLQEISNIMAGAYLNALTKLTSLNLLSSVPAYACDMAGAIINTVLSDLGMIGDYALLVETQFNLTEQKLNGHFFLVPDPGALETIMDSLGI